MSIINSRQQLSLMSASGKRIASLVIEKVHIKLGNKAFAELVATPMSKLDEFFWKYLKFEMNPKLDPVAELHRIHGILETLPDHPDIQVFQQLERGKRND